MPKIVPGVDLLAGFDPSSPLVPMPERGAVWSQAPELGGPGGALAKQLFALGNYKSFASCTQHALSQIGFLSGVPEWAVDGFEEFFKLAPTVQNGEQLAKGVIAGTAKLVQQALSQTATQVPIVGLIVQMGLYLWDIIDRAIAYTDVKERPPDQAIVYDLAADLEAANDLKFLSGQHDWTPMFAPPAEDAWQISQVAWTPGGGAQGFKFNIREDHVEAFGLMPGIAERVGTYQFPFKAVGFTDKGARPWDYYTGYGMSTTGQLLPSSRKFAALLWQTAMKPSVQMFQIDSVSIEDGWDAYYDSLWQLSNGDFSAFSDEKAELLRWGMRRACTYCRIVPTTSGPVIKPESEIEKYSVPKLRAKIGDLSYRYSDIIRYSCKIHRERAAKALKTIICAYVPADAPLIRASAKLAEAREDMRRALLESNARWSVEPDLIPDAEYRSAIVQATSGPPPKTSGIRPRMPPKVIPGNKPNAPDEGPLTFQAIPLGQTPGGGGSALVAVGVGLAVVGGVLVARRLG